MNASISRPTLSNDERLAWLEQAFEPRFMVLVAGGHEPARRVYEATIEKLDRAEAADARGQAAGAPTGGRVARVLGAATAEARATLAVEGDGGCDRAGAKRARQERLDLVNGIKAETAQRVAATRTFCAYDYFAGVWVTPAVLAERGRVLPHIHRSAPNGVENFPLTPALRQLVLEETFEPHFMALVAAGDPAAVRAYEAFARKLDEGTSAAAAQLLAAERPGENVAELIFAKISGAVIAAASEALAIRDAHELRERVERVRAANERVGMARDVARIRRETEEREDAGLSTCVYDYLGGRWTTPDSLVERGALLPHVHGFRAAIGAGSADGSAGV